MKLKALVLILISILFISGKKEKKEVFTLDGFEKTLSKVYDNFYMSKYEVSNLQYRTFLDELKKNGNLEKYSQAEVDSARWIDSLGINEVYVHLYLRHQAYNNYPVVNISYEGAVLFCEWLTDKYNNYEKRKFKKVKFRLPQQIEWEKAARGGIKEGDYPWGGRSLRNYKGDVVCNYFYIGDENIHFDKEKITFEILGGGAVSLTEDKGDLTCPVKSYYPNGFDIYNISGNVSEMTADKGIARGGSFLSPGYDVRIQSVDNYSHPDIYLGFRYCMDVIEQ